MKIVIENIDFEFNQTEFLVFSSFLIRCHKDFEWFIKNNIDDIDCLYSFIPIKYKSFITKEKTILFIEGKQFSFNQSEYEELVLNIKSVLALNFTRNIIDLNTIDGAFLEYILAVDLPYIISAKDETVDVDNLLVFNKDGNVVHIKESEHFKFVKNGDILNVLTRTNLLHQSHQARFALVKECLDKSGYGHTGEKMVVYNDDYVIRDGAHRAAYLIETQQNNKIEILRIKFEKNYFTFENFFRKTKIKFQSISLLENTKNTRWVLKNGKRLPYIRSDTIENITSLEMEKLRDLNVDTLIDFRNYGKDENLSKKFCDFNYYNIPLSLPKNFASQNKGLDFAPMYLNFLKEFKTIHEILTKLMENKNNTLFFCASGMDRTGVISCLLQLLSGCSDNEIIEEYAISHFIYNYAAENESEIMSHNEAKCVMAKFLELFRLNYHSVEDYLKLIGFDEKDVQLLTDTARRISE